MRKEGKMICKNCGKKSIEIREICLYCYGGIFNNPKNCKFCDGKGYIVINDLCNSCYMKIKTEFIPQIDEKELSNAIKYDLKNKTIIYEYDKLEKLSKKTQ
jgi:RecJ-like exonuclease